MKDLSSLIFQLRCVVPGLPVLEDEPLSRHCSLRIGGRCAALISPSSDSDLAAVCAILRYAGETPLIIGNGTNLLITEEDIPRIVVKLGEELSAIEQEDETTLRSGCGVPLAQLAATAAELSLSGLEFAQGIPGTLGGAICMNAGAYGGEMKDVLLSVRYLGEDMLIHETEELDLSYRHSRFSDTNDILLDAALRLQKGDKEAIQEKMRSLRERRAASQPLDLPSAGSAFKRPANGYAAALIDQAGLKGYAIGGAQVSEKHAGFVVNRGDATFEDVLRLLEHIQETVYRSSGVQLEPEIRIIRG